MDLISIIVPVYKVEKYLSECIDSILSQTYENFELILVDDGSPDNSGKICDKYAEQDSRIKVIHKENGGVSSARNVGLDNANGEYITFIDSDDTVDKQYLELMYNKLIETKSDLCFCHFDRFNEYGFKEYKEFIPDYELASIENDNFTKFINSFFTFKNRVATVCWRTLLKKEITNNFSFNLNLTTGEDLVYIINILLNCKAFSSISNILYHYRINTESVTFSYRKNALDKNIVFYEEFLKFRNIVSKKIFSAYCSHMCYGLFLNEIKFKSKETKKNIKKIKESKLYKYFRLSNIFKIRPFKTLIKNLFVWTIIKLHLY